MLNRKVLAREGKRGIHLFSASGEREEKKSVRRMKT
jgi:hypothetical protein